MKMHRSVHSQKFAEKRRKKQQALVFAIIICLLLCAAFVTLILRVSFLQIKTITVEGSTLSPSEAISASALSSLDKSYFYVLPFSNTFFYSKGSIKNTVKDQFKEVKDVSVHRSGFSGLKVTIIERTPVALVCAGFRADAGEGDCYLSDEHGYIFARAATSTGGSLTRYYVPNENATTTVGFNFIPEGRFKDLQNFIKGAAGAGLAPLGILIGEKGEYEMYIKNKKGDSETIVYFDDRSSFERTLGNLLTFWQNSDSAQKIGGGKDFEYINLRFGNTVYYSTE